MARCRRASRSSETCPPTRPRRLPRSWPRVSPQARPSRPRPVRPHPPPTRFGFPLRIDTNRKVLEQLALIGFYGLPLDWLDAYPARVRSVTLAQIRSAFARRVDPGKLSVVVVGAPD